MKTPKKRLGLLLAVATTIVLASGTLWSQPESELHQAMSAKKKTISLVNKQSSQAEVNINFGADSELNASDLAGFCDSTSIPLNCHLTLAGNSSKEIPNPNFKYVNLALAFNSPVTCGATKAEIIANNRKWFDIMDVSVVDGFNNQIEIRATPSGQATVILGPPTGLSGNQTLFGVYPFACTQCAAILNPPCGSNGAGECHAGTESNPNPPCQYQMNPDNGTIKVILLP
jgi:hypothetical protein